MKLSDTLRYMLYDTDEEFVLLQSEVNYLQDYVALEKLRLVHPQDVSFSIKGEVAGYLIAPLILLPLVENCFKHAAKSNPNIAIRLHQEGGKLLFEANNRVASRVDRGGLGISNLRKRLDLIYRDKHKLQLRRDGDRHLATLQLDLEL